MTDAQVSYPDVSSSSDEIAQKRELVDSLLHEGITSRTKIQEAVRQKFKTGIGNHYIENRRRELGFFHGKKKTTLVAKYKNSCYNKHYDEKLKFIENMICKGAFNKEINRLLQQKFGSGIDVHRIYLLRKKFPRDMRRRRGVPLVLKNKPGPKPGLKAKMALDAMKKPERILLPRQDIIPLSIKSKLRWIPPLMIKEKIETLTIRADGHIDAVALQTIHDIL